MSEFNFMLYSMVVFNPNNAFWIPSALIFVISTSPQVEPEIMALFPGFKVKLFV